MDTIQFLLFKVQFCKMFEKNNPEGQDGNRLGSTEIIKV